MKKLTAMLLALAMLLSLAACGSQPQQSGQDNVPPADAQSGSQADPAPNNGTSGTPDTPDAPAEGADPQMVEYYLGKANEVAVTDTHVTFTHDGTGEEISIEKGPKNVAVLFGSLTCLWYEAGGTVQLAVGGKSATSLYKEQIGRDITQDEGVTVVTESSSGTSWDVEKIIGGKPDLIVCSTGMKGYSTISGPAEAAGIPVIGINYDGVQDYLKWFKVFCNLNGQPQLWDDIAQATAEDIMEVVAKVPQAETAPTAIILVMSSDVLKAYTYGSQPGVMLKELGGVNLVDPGSEGAATSVEINLEDIYALDPDIIFMSEFGDTGLHTLEDMFGADPVWQELRAVKNNRVIALEKALFHNKANKNYNESYRTMAQYLYPDCEF